MCTVAHMNYPSINRRYCLYALGAMIVSPTAPVEVISGVLTQPSVSSDAGLDPTISFLDPLYAKAVEVVVSTQKASSSLVQRHLKIGYNRAIRLLDAMEYSGVVSALNAAGKRQVLVS